MRTRGASPNIRWILISTATLVLCCPLLGQYVGPNANPQIRTKLGKRFPTVTYSFVLWSADPSYFSVAIDSTGTATYLSAPTSVENTGVPYTQEFHVSDRTRRAAFNLTRDLDYFNQPVQDFLGFPQNSTIRTLRYHDSTFNNEMTYTSSSNPEVEELTSIFEEISDTLELGRRLAYLQEHDKASLEPELKRVQASLNRHSLREVEVLAPVLHRIADDKAASADVRSQAESLIKHLSQPL